MEIYQLYEEAKKFVEYIDNDEDAQILLNVEKCDFDAIDNKKLEDTKYMINLILQKGEEVFEKSDKIRTLILEDFLNTLSTEILHDIATEQFEADPKRSIEILRQMMK